MKAEYSFHCAIAEKGKSAMIFSTKKVGHGFDKGVRAHSDGRENDDFVETVAMGSTSGCLPTEEAGVEP